MFHWVCFERMTAPRLLALWCEARTLGLRPTYTDKASPPHWPFSTTEVVPFPLDGETSLGLKPEAAVLIPCESTTNGVTPGVIVKSNTDGLVGRVVRLENVSRGEFVQVQVNDPGGKLLGRKADTLTPVTD